MDDAEDVFNRWSGSAENSRFIMKSPHLSVMETKEMLKEHIRNYDKPDFYMWGIVFEGNLIGYICGNEMNEETKSICVGYCITKSFWNKGIATEATRAVIEFFFSSEFNRIFSYHNPMNPASGKVMHKCGMQFEGRIRGGSMFAGEICDCLQYAIMAEDYSASDKETEKQYNKLIRDNIPAIIRSQGNIPVIRTLEGEDYLAALDKKLNEEVQEYLEDKSIEEICDVLEVIDAICAARGVPSDSITTLKNVKRNKNGAFDKRIWLEKVIQADRPNE